MKKKHLSGSSNKVNVVEEQIKELDVMVLDLHISMITKVHMATFSDTNGWWYDYGMIVHICYNINQFKDYEIIVYRHEVFMDNHNAVNVHG